LVYAGKNKVRYFLNTPRRALNFCVVMDVDEAFATSVEVHYIFVECEIIA
jgi:hypothetical protein